jgi:GNAT superfamily N-acetyltransferase
VVSMAVLPESRQRGYGSLLLKEALRLVPTKTMVLTTYRDLNPAVRLYHREGFQDLVTDLSLTAGGAPMIVMARDTRPGQPS